MLWKQGNILKELLQNPLHHHDVHVPFLGARAAQEAEEGRAATSLQKKWHTSVTDGILEADAPGKSARRLMEMEMG